MKRIMAVTWLGGLMVALALVWNGLLTAQASRGSVIHAGTGSITTTLYVPLVIVECGPPTASFDYFPDGSPSPPLTVWMTDTSPACSLVTRTWDFGDNFLSPGAVVVSHTYISTGTYPITLTVANSKGSDQFTRYVHIGSDPVWITATYQGFWGLYQNCVSFDCLVAGNGGYTIQWRDYAPSYSAIGFGVTGENDNYWEGRDVMIFKLPTAAPKGRVLSATMEFSYGWAHVLSNGTVLSPSSVPVAFRQTGWTTATLSVDMGQIRDMWFDTHSAIQTTTLSEFSACEQVRVAIPADVLRVDSDAIGIMVNSAIGASSMCANGCNVEHHLVWNSACPQQHMAGLLRMLVQEE